MTAAAGLVSVRELTQARIDDGPPGATPGRCLRRRSRRGRAALLAAPGGIDAPVLLQPTLRRRPTCCARDDVLAGAFHMAALNHGVFLAGRGLMALSTVLTTRSSTTSPTARSALVAWPQEAVAPVPPALSPDAPTRPVARPDRPVTVAPDCVD